MDKTVLMVMGKSGSGKSTLERDLVDNYPDEFRKVVSVTTRAPRYGEVDGREYHFITEQRFDQLIADRQLIQTTKFAGNHYGSTRDEYTTVHPYAILVVVPHVARQFAAVLQDEFPAIDVYNIVFNISDQRLRENMRARGDSDSAIEQRLLDDNLDQDIIDEGIIPHFIVNDDLLDLNLHKRVKAQLDSRKELVT